MNQISSESPEFYRRYYKKHFGVYFLEHSVEENESGCFNLLKHRVFSAYHVSAGHFSVVSLLAQFDIRHHLLVFSLFCFYIF